MKTTINNNLRVYHVVTSTGHQYFCNIEDLNRVVIENNLRAGYFKIYHFWDNKPILLSKKTLKQMFEGSHLYQQFDYQSR
jgi:hypothetical protein